MNRKSSEITSAILQIRDARRSIPTTMIRLSVLGLEAHTDLGLRATNALRKSNVSSR
jgi:hypothetical protein